MKHKLSPEIKASLLKVYSPSANSDGAKRIPGVTNLIVGKYFDIVEQCPMCREFGSWLYFDYDSDKPFSTDSASELEGIITLKKIQCLVCFADELVAPIVDIGTLYGINLYHSHAELGPLFDAMFEFTTKNVMNGCRMIHMYGPSNASGFFMAPDPIMTLHRDPTGAGIITAVESPFNRARHIHPTEFYTLAHKLFPQFYTKINSHVDGQDRIAESN